MKKVLKWFLLCSLVVNGLFIYSWVKKNEINRKPPWSPFELNSNITLGSLVENGYKFVGMPCGQVQYAKSFGDTTIQYEIEVDCNSYFGKYKPDTSFLESYLTPKTNPFYPYNFKEIKKCYQGIAYRFYMLNFSDANSDQVIRFVEKNDCILVPGTFQWDEKSNGQFIVYNPSSKLYFICRLEQEVFDEKRKNEWTLVISSQIPYLDQFRIKREKERQRKKERYFDNYWKSVEATD
ncbi:MAG: hypothetical protein DWQ02_17875 [Bacteroidetes bacterium]|nr:MAG: hypothetical protein DWQ02_17875 [Bacteroidota bacterium]